MEAPAWAMGNEPLGADKADFQHVKAGGRIVGEELGAGGQGLELGDVVEADAGSMVLESRHPSGVVLPGKEACGLKEILDLVRYAIDLDVLGGGGTAAGEGRGPGLRAERCCAVLRLN